MGYIKSRCERDGAEAIRYWSLEFRREETGGVWATIPEKKILKTRASQKKSSEEKRETESKTETELEETGWGESSKR